MNLRKAVKKDIAKLNDMYMAIIEDMQSNNICIWDDIYPIEQIEFDILDGAMYVLENEGNIVGAFSVYDTNSASNEIEWHDTEASAIYLGLIAVNMNNRRQGVGRLVINEAVAIAKSRGVEYVRLLVEDRNVPAINMYTKYGFEKKRGVHKESYPDRNLYLVECGYEKRI